MPRRPSPGRAGDRWPSCPSPRPTTCAREDRPQRGRDPHAGVRRGLRATSGITKDDIDFICSGSTDYLVGGPFSFVAALDAIGVWPPRSESHVEMDAAWALYEAWVPLQEGGSTPPSSTASASRRWASCRKILALQLDPYVMAPLWPDPVSLAALQARALLDAGRAERGGLRRGGGPQPAGRPGQPQGPGRLRPVGRRAAGRGLRGDPLRRHTLPPITDGAAAVVLAAGDRAYEWAERPAWITGIDHRIETHALGARDLATSPSTARAGRGGRRGRGNGRTWPSCTPPSPTRS